MNDQIKLFNSNKQSQNSGISRIDNDFAKNAKLSIINNRDLVLLFLMLTKINSKGDITTGIIKLNDIKDHFSGHSSNSLNEKIYAAMVRLVKADFRLLPDEKNPKRLPKVVNIFESLDTEKIDGEIIFQFQFTESMKPYVIGLQGNFLTFPIPKGLRNSYALRFLVAIKADYDRVKKHTPIFTYKIEIKRFRELLDLEKKYSQFKELKRRIIEPIINEINQYDIISVANTAYVKSGRKVKAIELTIKEGSNANENVISKILKQESSLKIEAGKNNVFPKVTFSQKKAYEFLLEKKINEELIYPVFLEYIEREFSSECQGWEDIFFELTWQCFLEKTKYKKENALAGAFVKWWKNKHFKEKHFSVIMEGLQSVKKSKTPEERDNRENAKGVPYDEFVSSYFSTRESN